MRKRVGNRKTSETDIAIGNRLKFLRILKGISQKQLGEFINVSAQQFQKYERGVNRISGSNLNILAGVLEVTINDFFENKAHVISDNINEKELLSLINSYNIIKNEELRKIINRFIKSISLLKVL